MRTLDEALLPVQSPSGDVLAHVRIVPVRTAEARSAAPLVLLAADDASQFGESEVQLLEGERYEYEVVDATRSDLRLICSLNPRRTRLRSSTAPDAGFIETGDYCGTLLLTLSTADSVEPLGSVCVDVRSIKLDYRSEYRGMLGALSERIASLVLDARSSVKVPLRANLEKSPGPGWFQIQLEFLRDVLEGNEFGHALERISLYTHEQVTQRTDVRAAGAPGRWTARSIRQLIGPGPRRTLSASHHIRVSSDVRSVAETVEVGAKVASIDTPENRFVKFVLTDWRELLVRAQSVFSKSTQWKPAEDLADRLAGTIDRALQRGIFREIGDLRIAPLASPVLQRRAGYREVLRWWLKLHAAAEVSWDGGEELFKAGERRVATLYEYWLFFQLLDWYCTHCRDGARPALHELLDGLQEGAIQLRLKRGSQLGPFEGVVERNGRRLRSRFSYNKRFSFTNDRGRGGSWTRTQNPDYTLTFWPDGLSEEEAEECELLVHVHFDAKYRVETVDDLFGSPDDSSADEEVAGNYKRQDLLKMHAYRDAIRRSQGAYILYPGKNVAPAVFRGFYHEILPGLGAFGVAPDPQGQPKGMDALTEFLNDVLAHLSNRTTAQERVSYHIGQAYTLREAPVDYGSLALRERDQLNESGPALPPAEHMVLVIDGVSDADAAWMIARGLAFLQLSRRLDAPSVPLQLSSARHVLFRTGSKRVPMKGMMSLSEPGYSIFTDRDLTALGFPNTISEGVFAAFRVSVDPDFREQAWDRGAVTQALEVAERRTVYGIRTQAAPLQEVKLISLRELLQARLTTATPA